jgi:uncharacterized membrane protein
MHIVRVVRAIAVVCIGLLAGIYLADRASAPARATLDASSFVEYQQTVHVTYVRMMLPLVFAAILAAVSWLFLVRLQWRGAEFWLVAASTVGILFVATVTRVVNVPLNEQLMTWSVATPPANLKELWAPWEQVDAIRTVVAVGAFAVQAFALCFFEAPGSLRSIVKPGAA